MAWLGYSESSCSGEIRGCEFSQGDTDAPSGKTRLKKREISRVHNALNALIIMTTSRKSRGFLQMLLIRTTAPKTMWAKWTASPVGCPWASFYLPPPQRTLPGSWGGLTNNRNKQQKRYKFTCQGFVSVLSVKANPLPD